MSPQQSIGVAFDLFSQDLMTCHLMVLSYEERHSQKGVGEGDSALLLFGLVIESFCILALVDECRRNQSLPDWIGRDAIV